MYGTPWHGDGYIANQGRARLRRVVFLRHGARNEFAPGLPAPQSIARLFSCSFPPFHDAAGLDYSLRFLERVAGVLPVRRARVRSRSRRRSSSFATTESGPRR